MYFGSLFVVEDGFGLCSNGFGGESEGDLGLCGGEGLGGDFEGDFGECGGELG